MYKIMELLWSLGILLLLPKDTIQISDPNSLSYFGAVVEYHPVLNSVNNEKPADINAKNYEKIIRRASYYLADIIVFPEIGLSISSSTDSKLFRSEAASYMPDPKDKLVICDNNTYLNSLRKISCAAREYNMYVVVNHQEKVDCLKSSAGCPDDNFLIYNTNVVFDRKGKLIAKYRKYNLFYEPGVNVTKDAEISTFRTDFDVTFGQIICADIMFSRPALNLTKQMGIHDIVYPSMWFSELPLFFSLEMHAGWAQANDVNLLSSGRNTPGTGNSGTGIYIGREGFAHLTLETKPSNVLIVSEIPKVINGQRFKSIDRRKTRVVRFRDLETNTAETNVFTNYKIFAEDLSNHTTKIIDPTQTEHEEILCNRGLCCHFKLSVFFENNTPKNDTQYYRYRMTVFNGTRFLSKDVGLLNCGIVACANETITSCGKLIDSGVSKNSLITFLSAEITMYHEINDNYFFMPATLSKSLRPFKVNHYKFETGEVQKVPMHKIILTVGRHDLLTFSIWGRNFAADGL